MEKKLISIITISKYCDDSLLKTIESLRNVSFVEHIIISGEPAVDDFESYNSSFYYSEPAGIYPAMAEGIKKSNCEYIWFINAGDEFDRSAAGEVVMAVQANPCLIKGMVSCYDLEGEFKFTSPRGSIFEVYNFHHQALIIKRELVSSWIPSYSVSGDKDMYLYASSKASRVFTTNSVLGIMELGGVSQNGSREFVKFSEDTRIDLKYGLFSSSRFIKRVMKVIFKVFLRSTLGEKRMLSFLRVILR